MELIIFYDFVIFNLEDFIIIIMILQFIIIMVFIIVSGGFEYDLFNKFVFNFDCYMIFFFFEFSVSQFVDEDGQVRDEVKVCQIIQVKFVFMKCINMIDYVVNLYCEFEGFDEVFVEYIERKKQVFSQLEKYE